MNLLMGGAKNHKAIKLQPTPSLVLAVLAHPTSHKKLWEQRRAVNIWSASSTTEAPINYWVRTMHQALHMQPFMHEVGRLRPWH